MGFLLPMASLGLFLMIVNSRRETNPLKTAPPPTGWKATCISILYTFRPMNFLRSLWQLRPITGTIVILSVALPWYIMVGLRTDGLWLQQFFAKFNLRPFMQPILGHSGPFWLHIPYLLIGFFPWSVFLGPAIIETIRRIRDRDPRQYAYVLLTCWFSMFFIFWSICSTKLPHYVLPVYPALALLTGCFLETWITEPARVGPGWMKNAWITTIAAGLGIMVAVGHCGADFSARRRTDRPGGTDPDSGRILVFVLRQAPASPASRNGICLHGGDFFNRRFRLCRTAGRSASECQAAYGPDPRRQPPTAARLRIPFFPPEHGLLRRA